MSIITYPLDGVTYSAEDVATYLCTRTSGVYAKDSNFAASITGTRQVTIAPGLAWINYDDFKGVSACSWENTVLTVPDADNTLNRVDRVVLQFDTASNLTAIRLKTGTPAVAAQPPDILQNHNQYELGLCTISVPAGSAAISAADITDTRADETVCGLMRDGVTGIPTQQLVAQWQAMQAAQTAAADALLKTTQQQAEALLGSYTGGYLHTDPLTLAPADWTDSTGGYPYQCIAPLALCTAQHVPLAVFAPDSQLAATSAGVAPLCKALAGSVCFYARTKPSTTLTVQLTLFGPQKEA